jgi:hypothetical protein
MLQPYQILFSGIIIFLTTTLLNNSSHKFFKHRYVIDKPNFKISYYGLFAGIAGLLATPFLLSCGILQRVLLVVSLYFMSTYIFCEPCRNGGYHMVATYYLLLPLCSLFFSCTELQSFTLAMAVFLSICRLGCLFAGCCHGKEIPEEIMETDKPQFYMLYPDSKQIINQAYQKEQTYALPTALVEAILQSILALACLMYPDNSNFIYGMGSILIILFSKCRSEKSSRQQQVNLAIVGCLLYVLTCYFKLNSENQCYRILNMDELTARNITRIIISTMIVIYGLSNDIQIKNFAIISVLVVSSFKFF